MTEAEVNGVGGASQSEASQDVEMDEAVMTPTESTQEKPNQEVNLEDMFPDDESEDEFTSSRPQDTPTSSPDAPSSPGPGYVPTIRGLGTGLILT